MNRRFDPLVSLLAVALLAVTPLSFGQEQSTPPEHKHKEPASSEVSADDSGEHKPGMHMHKSDMTHRSDKEAAADYKGEAAELREKAESHRKLAKLYLGRTPPKGGANYANVAKHCESLAKKYEEAAKDADAVASELSK